MEANSRLQSLQSRYFPLNHEGFTDMGVLSWIEAHPLPPHIDEGLLRYWKSSERSQAITVPDSSMLPGHLPRTFWYLQSAKKSELGKGTWHTRSANQPRNAKCKDSKASNIPAFSGAFPIWRWSDSTWESGLKPKWLSLFPCQWLHRSGFFSGRLFSHLCNNLRAEVVKAQLEYSMW